MVASTIRERVLPPSWDCPETSLLTIYLDACKDLGVTAQSGVVRKLFHRSRMTQPWPMHKVQGLDRAGLLQLIFDHATAACSSSGQQQAALRASVVDQVIGLVNPRLSLEQAAAAAGEAVAPTPPPQPQPPAASASSSQGPDIDPPSPSKAQPMIPVIKVRKILEAAAASVSEQELRQAALDVISTYEAPGGGQVPEPRKLAGLLVDRLDLEAKGSVDCQELRSLCAALNPASSQSVDWSALPPVVERQEAVVVLVTGVLEKGAKGAMAVYDVLNARLSPQYEYDLGSEEYLGPRGLLPLLPVLRADQTFSRLNLSGCGLNCSAVEKLCATLEGHAHLTAIDLSRNPIADRGGAALARLLRTNRHITHLNIAHTPLVLPRSRTHHNRLGPSGCEDGGAVMAALETNVQLARKGARELVEQLLSQSEDLAAIFYGLATGHWAEDVGGGDGGAQDQSSPACGTQGALDTQVPLALLSSQLKEVAVGAWGYEEGAVEEVLLHARLLGAGAARGRVDDDGSPLAALTHISHGGFVAVLRAAARDFAAPRAARVAGAVQRHRAAVKRAFYGLEYAGDDASGNGAGGGDDDRVQQQVHCVSLLALRKALLQLAVADLWPVSEEDVLWTLTPRTFTEGVPPGVEAPVWASGGVTLTWAAFYGKLMWLLTA